MRVGMLDVEGAAAFRIDVGYASERSADLRRRLHERSVDALAQHEPQKGFR